MTDGLAPGLAVKTYGNVDPRAVQESLKWLALETKRPDVAQALGAGRTTVVIIPHDVRMTDLPEYANLRGQKTFDGRVWDDVRGSGGQTITDPADGKPRIVVAIAEEVLADLPNDTYGPDYSVGAHEIAHVVEDFGLPQAERDALFQEHADFVASLPKPVANSALTRQQSIQQVEGGQGAYYSDPSWYGNQTPYEKFAMTFNVLTGTDQYEGPQFDTPNQAAAFLNKVDPDLLARMTAVYPGRTALPNAGAQDPWYVPPP